MDYCGCLSNRLNFTRIDHLLNATNVAFKISCSCSSSFARKHATYYDVLGVSQNASQREVKSAFIKLSKQFHPDVDRSNPKLHKKFIVINDAYMTLGKAETRWNYDMKLMQEKREGDLDHKQPQKEQRQSTDDTMYYSSYNWNEPIPDPCVDWRKWEEFRQMQRAARRQKEAAAAAAKVASSNEARTPNDNILRVFSAYPLYVVAAMLGYTFLYVLATLLLARQSSRRRRNETYAHLHFIEQLCIDRQMAVLSGTHVADTDSSLESVLFGQTNDFVAEMNSFFLHEKSVDV